MTKRTTLATALALLIVSGFITATPASAEDLTGKNEVSVTVLDWYSNLPQNITHSVAFRVSFDDDGDGTYEHVFTSATYKNSTGLTRPFEAHAYVQNSTPTVTFLVEVLLSDSVSIRVVNGSGPVHNVTNEVNATGSWVYNNLNTTGTAEDAYYIYYGYEVSPTYQPDASAARTTRWNGTSNTFDTITILSGSIAAVVIAAAAAAVVVVWRSRRRSPP